MPKRIFVNFASPLLIKNINHMHSNNTPLLTFLLFCIFITASFAQKSALEKEKNAVIEALEKRHDEFGKIAHQIWDLAELGYQEYKSTKLLQDKLKSEGFKVESGVAEIPTAFLASYGSGEPVIGVLAEFDALPGVSQTASPTREERTDNTAGHACGHHLFGVGSTAAAIAIKDWLKASGKSGTIRVYGTPAEEGGAGKVYMVRAGLFDDVDAVLHWHPADRNSASARSSLANKSAKFRFHGTASHASAAPERGRSALDGVEALNYMVNMMREHIPSDARIHYVITRGGEAPNVVPAFAEVYYYVRHPEVAVAKDIFDRVAKAAEGAALGTGTKLEYEIIHGIYNVLPNEILSKTMYENLNSIGGVTYNEAEHEFAQKIMSTYRMSMMKPEMAEKIEPFEVVERGTGGSTDVGDVSWTVPTAGLAAATWVPGTSAHSWQAVAAGGTNIGVKGMMVAAKTIALTAMDIFQSPNITQKALEELNERRGADFKYESLLGDRKPPLDYRN